MNSDDITPPPEEFAVRQAFDQFCTWLLRFAVQAQTRVYKYHQLHPYLLYYMDCLSGDPGDDDWGQTIRAYLETYGYEAILDLADKLNVSITPSLPFSGTSMASNKPTDPS